MVYNQIFLLYFLNFTNFSQYSHTILFKLYYYQPQDSGPFKVAVDFSKLSCLVVLITKGMLITSCIIYWGREKNNLIICAILEFKATNTLRIAQTVWMYRNFKSMFGNQIHWGAFKNSPNLFSKSLKLMLRNSVQFSDMMFQTCLKVKIKMKNAIMCLLISHFNCMSKLFWHLASTAVVLLL